jgi:hypothetical protein
MSFGGSVVLEKFLERIHIDHAGASGVMAFFEVLNRARSLSSLGCGCSEVGFTFQHCNAMGRVSSWDNYILFLEIETHSGKSACAKFKSGNCRLSSRKPWE